MKNNIIIYSYLGLGDHFICSGAVRKIYKEEDFDNLYLIIKKRDTKNIKFLYKDLNKLKLIKVKDDNGTFVQEIKEEVEKFIKPIIKKYPGAPPDIFM